MIVIGGRGFIGTNLAARHDCETFDLIDGQDALNYGRLLRAMWGHDTVVHLASNADIAAGASDPSLDLSGIDITRNVCRAAREAGAKTILYASGSGVYGARSICWPDEQTVCVPTSAYGASKLASEAVLAAYSNLYGITVHAFRFANVVGPHQTHGVGYDFLRKLRADPLELEVLGDGYQTKPYVHVEDALDAMDIVREIPGFNAWNVGPEDDLTVFDIARYAAERLGCLPVVRAAGGLAWAGDITKVRLDTTKIRSTGWTCRTSQDAMRQALVAL